MTRENNFVKFILQQFRILETGTPLIMVKHWCAVRRDINVQVSGGQQGSLTLTESWYHGMPGWKHSGNLAVLLSATGSVYWFKT